MTFLCHLKFTVKTQKEPKDTLLCVNRLNGSISIFNCGYTISTAHRLSILHIRLWQYHYGNLFFTFLAVNLNASISIICDYFSTITSNRHFVFCVFTYTDSISLLNKKVNNIQKVFIYICKFELLFSAFQTLLFCSTATANISMIQFCILLSIRQSVFANRLYIRLLSSFTF